MAFFRTTQRVLLGTGWLLPRGQRDELSHSAKVCLWGREQLRWGASFSDQQEHKTC